MFEGGEWAPPDGVTYGLRNRFPVAGWQPAWPYEPGMFREFSTADTVRAMELAAKADQWKPRVRALASRAWREAGGIDAEPLKVVLAVERVVREAVTYMPDPHNVELVTAPETLLSMEHPVEDCDGMSTLAACVLLALDFAPRYDRLDFTGAGDPDPYEHVLVQVPVRGFRTEAVIDPTYPGDLAGLLASVKAHYVHDPIGRDSVRPKEW